MLASPMLWVAVAGWLAAVAGVGVQELLKTRQWQAAYAEGKAAGRGGASADALAAAKATADAEREAAENTPLPVELLDKIALCKRSPACRDRGKAK